MAPVQPDSCVVAGDLATRFGGELLGVTPDRQLRRLASLEGAGPDDLAFLASPRFRAAARDTRAALVIVSPALADCLPAGVGRLLVTDPYACYAQVSQWLAALAAPQAPLPGVHPSAIVDPSAVVDGTARIGPGCVVEANARVGADVTLDAQVVIGRGATVGASTLLHARVVLYPDCHIGERCLVHAGTVIGADGFGFAPTVQGWVKIAQLGRVLIGNDVEIGANCTIDRGALDDTLIGDGCKLDNLIQIGHNVRIGPHTAIAGCVGIAGSAVIGSRCMIGGGAGILGHLSICDGAIISAMSLVTRSVREPGMHTGVFPLMGNAQWEQAAATLRQLPQLRQRLRRLEGGQVSGPTDRPEPDDDSRKPS